VNVFTIGYGGRTKAEFLALLHAHHVRTVVDIRLRPHRASMGIWVKAKTADKGIERWLADAAIGYQSLVELGNVFRDCPDWQPRYRALLDSAGPLLTARLAGLPPPFCLLCAERRVEECHRQEVARWLGDHRGAVDHQLEKGLVQRHDSRLQGKSKSLTIEPPCQ
jgi:uncharacterized protein (DUF488 family)